MLEALTPQAPNLWDRVEAAPIGVGNTHSICLNYMTPSSLPAIEAKCQFPPLFLIVVIFFLTVKTEYKHFILVYLHQKWENQRWAKRTECFKKN